MHRGSVTLVQQKASVLCRSACCIQAFAVLLCAEERQFDVHLHLQGSVCFIPWEQLFPKVGVKQKMGTVLFVLSWGSQLLQGLSMRFLLWLELVSLQLYLQKDQFNTSHKTAWICKETVHC